jgi:hypothetical protein
VSDIPDSPDDDDRPWERPGAVRRDYEPHRGSLLESLAWGFAHFWPSAYFCRGLHKNGVAPLCRVVVTPYSSGHDAGAAHK